MNKLSLAFSKRKYFVAEKELRLLYIDNDARLNDNSPYSISFHVDLNELIDLVYVAPKSYLWFQGAITHLIQLYGVLDVSVLKSRI